MSLAGQNHGPGARGQLLTSRPIRKVLRWQGAVALAGAVIAGALGGVPAALSAAAGGFIPLLSTVVYAVVVGRGDKIRAEGVIFAMLRAEGAKIVTIVLGLWVALRWLPQVVGPALFATFVVSVLSFSAAFLAQERSAGP